MVIKLKKKKRGTRDEINSFSLFYFLVRGDLGQGAGSCVVIKDEFYWVLLGFTRFYLVLLGFTGFYWVLLGFT